MARSQRVQWVDIAKGLCILLIVVHHVSMYPFSSEILLELQASVSAIRVPLFFFCSGLFATRLLSGSLTWLWQKRIWPWLFPFTLWTFIYHMGIHQMSPADTVPMLVHPESFLWFLQALILYSILTWLTRFIPRVLVFLISLLPLLFFPLSDILGDYYGIMRWWPVFLCGLYSRYLIFPDPKTHESGIDKVRRRPGYQLAAVGIFSGIVSLALCMEFLEVKVIQYDLFSSEAWAAYDRLKLIPIALNGVALAIFFAMLLERQQSVLLSHVADLLALAGRHTLPIYLSHLPVNILFEYHAVELLGWTSWADAHPIMMTVIGTGICLAIAMLLELLATRVPGCRWLVYAPGRDQRKKEHQGSRDRLSPSRENHRHSIVLH
ncbi:acyltransferase family protein [Corynebacterium poyangense]|uniref:Acyltransferase family protein n=1 Tax=Corynebacterium poyangense TaxID=2684405 RepID=A0A7H0SLZ8_9CORY|nr:acyltransferase family protein [Corynebacterium poyangense]MBZ8177683.1 acyltransferase family protein [Corynebacterium poyangense]QNQ89573.1 acyltransferase family protein [Corynebacterium poyangense]